MSQQNKGNFADNPKAASEAGKKGGKASQSKTTSKQTGNSKGSHKSWGIGNLEKSRWCHLDFLNQLMFI